MRVRWAARYGAGALRYYLLGSPYKEKLEYFEEDIVSTAIKTKHYLYLSGTPFRAIASGEFIEDQIYNWTYSDEQRAKENSTAFNIYGNTHITERHRHRYEFNNKYLEQFEDNGMIASGFNPDSNLVEIVEIPSHKFFIGVQYHPELKSTILKPHPLFCGFVKACLS